jgi:SAM-dependent methyltransferase
VTEPLRTLDPSERARTELLDLGCGDGRSLTSAARRFGVPGVGLDLSAGKVRRAQAEGRSVYRADIRDLDPGDFPSVRYVMMDNVLEHLPDLDEVASVVASACALASRLVHIRHPSFEDVDYLAAHGLKQYWTDWPGVHTAPIRLHEFVAMAAAAGVYRVEILPVLRALDAADPTLLPLDAPSGQRKLDRAVHGAYDPVAHGPKPHVVLERPVYYAFDVLLVTGEEMPIVTYPSDPETSGGRPAFTWASDGGQGRPPRSRSVPARALGRLGRSVRR